MGCLPSDPCFKSQQVIQSESFYHSTKAPLQVFMATSHDSLLYQPEGDTGWSCGPFTVVKFLGSLLHLERNGETKFFGYRARFRLVENCNWKQLDGMVISSDHVGFPSKVPHVKKMDNFFGLGTVWSKNHLRFLPRRRKCEWKKLLPFA